VSLLATPSFDETAAALNDSGLTLLPINDTQPYFPREATADPPGTESPGTVPPVRSPATPPSVPTQRTESPVPTSGTLPPLPTRGTVQPPAEPTTTAIEPPTRVETTSSSPESSVSQLSASEDYFVGYTIIMMRPAALIEHRLVTDRQTDGQTDGHRTYMYTAICICVAS